MCISGLPSYHHNVVQLLQFASKIQVRQDNNAAELNKIFSFNPPILILTYYLASIIDEVES